MTDVGGGAAYDVALQPDGKIVAVGYGAGGFAVARYNPNGSLDTSFDADGKVATDFGGGMATGVALQPDGKIVVAGHGSVGFAMARYNPNGSLDASFGAGGKVTTDFNGAGGIALQDDGKIVAVGSAPGFGGYSDLALARYNANGSLDTSFGQQGTQITDADWGGDDALADVAIGPDGTIATVGQSYCFICSSTTLVLAVYTRDGVPSGLHMTNVDSTDSGSSVAIQSDGKIVAAGGTIDDFLVARYDSGGSPDPSFSDDGIQTTDFGGADGAGGVALQPDGKILVAGTSYTYAVDGSAIGRFAIARYEGGSVSGTAPVNSAPPTISGTAAEGQKLTANAGAWTGTTPFNRGYQWRRCDSAGANCLDIAAASATTYVLAPADVGQTIRVRETATNAYGQSSSDSPATAVVSGNAPVNSTPPVISGTAAEGQQLTANAGAWTGSTPMNRGYQWRRCDSVGANCVGIAGASATSYTLAASDVGHTIRVSETATNAYGTGSVDSLATAAVKPKPGTIAGKVTNSNKKAIARATVSCGSAGTATTNATGDYSVTTVPPGTYTCTASATGYAAKTQNVTISPGNQTTANFSLVRQ